MTRLAFRGPNFWLPFTPVGLDRYVEIIGPTVVEEEDPLAQAPQWRGPDLVTAGCPLENVVGKSGSHLVQR
jgi:hypothetical protein